MQKSESVRERIVREQAQAVRAWAVAVMNAAALLAVHALKMRTFDGDIAERFNSCCEELLCAFERMPPTKEESTDA